MVNQQVENKNPKEKLSKGPKLKGAISLVRSPRIFRKKKYLGSRIEIIETEFNRDKSQWSLLIYMINMLS